MTARASKSIEIVYGEPKVIKQECIGHYQKRVGNRLRKLRKAEKLGGARLTNKKIDTLKNDFGIALRQNNGDLQANERCYYVMFVSRLWLLCRLSNNVG